MSDSILYYLTPREAGHLARERAEGHRDEDIRALDDIEGAAAEVAKRTRRRVCVVDERTPDALVFCLRPDGSTEQRGAEDATRSTAVLDLARLLIRLDLADAEGPARTAAHTALSAADKRTAQQAQRIADALERKREGYPADPELLTIAERLRDEDMAEEPAPEVTRHVDPAQRDRLEKLITQAYAAGIIDAADFGEIPNVRSPMDLEAGARITARGWVSLLNAIQANLPPLRGIRPTGDRARIEAEIEALRAELERA